MAQTYNPDEFYPHAGKEINSAGNIVNPADSVDSNGNQGVMVNGRKVIYQRVLAGQTITASGGKQLVVNVGTAKGLNLVFNTTGIAQLQVYGADANGNAITAGSPLFNTNATGYTSGVLIVSEWGGAPYVTVYVQDKSAATNTINFVDVWASQA